LYALQLLPVLLGRLLDCTGPVLLGLLVGLLVVPAPNCWYMGPVLLGLWLAEALKAVTRSDILHTCHIGDIANQ